MSSTQSSTSVKRKRIFHTFDSSGLTFSDVDTAKKFAKTYSGFHYLQVNNCTNRRGLHRITYQCKSHNECVNKIRLVQLSIASEEYSLELSDQEHSRDIVPHLLYVENGTHEYVVS